MAYMDRYRRLATVAMLAVLVAGCGTRGEPAGSEPTGSTSPGSEATRVESSAATTTTDQGAAVDDPLGGRPPLWPFSNPAEVAEWQSRGPGHSPWHLDAEATALFFTANHLGFTDVNQVVDSEIGSSEAKVTVGYRGELPRAVPAAVLLLVRYGEGEEAPWEVVGTVDDTLRITSPAPGARVSSPVTVEGRITGVDESIHVQVRDPGQPRPVGDSCCLPAGGENTPWTATVAVQGASKATLTIVAATGGHVADVERFAVTGVRLTG